MKKAILIISTIIIFFSVIFFVYGTIKLAEVAEPQNITIDLAESNEFNLDNSIELETPDLLVNPKNAQSIIGISLVTFVLGIVGLVFSLNSSKNSTV